MFCFVATHKSTGKYLYLELLEVKSYEKIFINSRKFSLFLSKIFNNVGLSYDLCKFFFTLSDE